MCILRILVDERVQPLRNYDTEKERRRGGEVGALAGPALKIGIGIAVRTLLGSHKRQKCELFSS